MLANDVAAKRAAGIAARAALASGEIVKGDTCEECGRADKRLILHHPDYSDHLHVQTLCERCHRLVHGILKRASA